MNKNIINEYIIFGTREDFLPFVFCLINFESPKKHNELTRMRMIVVKPQKNREKSMGKKLISTAFVLPLSMFAVSAFAASVDLKVIGTITPASCTPTFSGGGIIDYGTMPASTLSATAQTTLPDKTSALTITCDAAVKYGVSVLDNRAASAVNTLNTIAGYTAANKFGLGAVNGVNIGTYSIQLTSPTPDSGTTNILNSTDSGATWTASNGAVANNAMIGFGNSATATTATPHKTMNIGVRVVAAIVPANSLPLSSSVKIDGSTTFTVSYL